MPAVTFTRLPYKSTGGGPSIDESKVTGIGGELVQEVDATRHWVLGDDNTRMVDLMERAELVPVNGASLPTQHAGYTTIQSGIAGLSSGVADAEEQTICAVVNVLPGELSKNSYFGTFDGTVGGMVFATTNGDNIAVNRKSQTSGAEDIEQTVATGWRFLAMSEGDGETIGFAANSTLGHSSVSEAAGARDASSAAICLGNGYYGSGYNTDALQFAEFLIFPYKMTLVELDGVYQRSRTRLASRIGALV